jgi:peroxiredoxin
MIFFRAGILLLILWSGAGSLHAGQVFLECHGQGYEGKEIRAYLTGHPFLDIPSFDTTLVFDDRGNFSLRMEIPGPGMLQLASGVYEGGLFIRPDREYRVELPAFREAAHGDRISPFFEPVRLTLIPEGEHHTVNHAIVDFDSLFLPLNEQVVQARRKGSPPVMDSLLEGLLTEFQDLSDPWFRQYMQYRSGTLALNAGQSGLGEISQKYLGPVVRETHPAYLELFGAMFRDFLFFYAQTPQGNPIHHHINRTHNLDSLRRVLRRHEAISNDTLCDLILLQELPRIFYQGTYHKEAILILLDSLGKQAKKPEHALYARQSRQHLASLMIGNPPPAFRLPSRDGALLGPAEMKGKYSFFIFCTPEHYGCMMEYPYLQSYVEKHSDYLNVVAVMVTEDEDQLWAFMERNGYDFQALHLKDQIKILKRYLVRAFPVAYLTGPDGLLILSPSPLPSDGFEQQLFKIMRSRGDI